MNRRRTIVAVVVVLMILGGGLTVRNGTSWIPFVGTPKQTEATYREQFSTWCADLARTPLPGPEQANPTQAEIRTVSLTIADNAATFRTKFASLHPPDSLKTPHEQFLDGLDRTIDAYRQIAGLAAKGQMASLSNNTPQWLEADTGSTIIRNSLKIMGYDDTCQPLPKIG